MKTIFKDYTEMLSEADALVREDEHDAEDRACIQDFYNGRETMSAAEAEKRGVDNITNHLFGYDSISAAAGQLMGIYTKGDIMFNLKFPNAPLENRRKWEMCATAKLNRIIKESRRLKPEWKSLSGEVTLHGRACFMFVDNEDWCPKIARPYVPRGTGILSGTVPYCVIPDHLTIVELEAALKSSEERKKKGWPVFWKMNHLRTTINMLRGNIGGTPGVSFSPSNVPVDEAAELRQAGAEGAAGLRTRIPVYYLYYKKEDDSFSMVILPRLTAVQQKTLSEKVTTTPDCLFEREDYFDRPEHFLHPYFIDCELGGKTTWHRVMGLGRLNYEPDVETEEFFNDAMQGSRENLRRLYQVGTAADWEMLKSWASSSGPTNVLPPGVTLAEARLAPNFQHAFTTMEMLMNLSRKNSTGHSANVGSNDPNELEINALERQGRNAEALSTRIADVYECSDALGMEIFRRFLAESPLPQDPGYCEIMEFQRAMREEGVSLSHLRKVRDGKYVNFTVYTSRAVGDGSKVKQAMANQMLMSRLPLFNAEAQQIILRRITAEETGDYDFAQQLVPYERKEDPDQVQRANQENDTADRQGIIGVVPQLSDDDVDAVHLGHHFRSMQADLARGKIRPWDQIDLAGFKSKGAHAAMHVQKISAIPEQKELATQMKQTLEGLAKQGQEFENNLQKQEEARDVTPVQKAELEIKGRKQALAEHAQSSLEQHRGASLDLSREKAEVGSMVSMRQTALNEQKTLHDERMSEADRVAQARERGAAAGERVQERAEAKAEPPEAVEEPEFADNPVP